MSTFTNKMSEFLTKEENFESAFEINQQLPSIIEELKKGFWGKVAEKMRERCKNTKWRFYPENDGEIGIYLNDWDNEIDYKFWIGFESIYSRLNYCLFINESNKKFKIDTNKTDKYVSDNKLFEDMEGDTDYWRKYTSDNFNEARTLIRILPTNREEFANELVEMLFVFADENKDHINKMNRMIKK